MSDEPPTPPASLAPEVVDTLTGIDPESLRDVARYVEKLADHKERKTRREADTDDDEDMDRPDDLPDGVPSKATITVKEINGNRYHYWQWREGERVKSKYKGPVNPED